VRECGVLARDAVFDFVEGEKVPVGFTGVALVKHKRLFPNRFYASTSSARTEKSYDFNTPPLALRPSSGKRLVWATARKIWPHSSQPWSYLENGRRGQKAGDNLDFEIQSNRSRISIFQKTSYHQSKVTYDKAFENLFMWPGPFCHPSKSSPEGLKKSGKPDG